MNNIFCNIRTRSYEQETFANSGGIEVYLSCD